MGLPVTVGAWASQSCSLRRVPLGLGAHTGRPDTWNTRMKLFGWRKNGQKKRSTLAYLDLSSKPKWEIPSRSPLQTKPPGHSVSNPTAYFMERSGREPPTMTKGVDKEFYLLFGVFDENLSWYLDVNLKYYLRKEEAFEDDGFQESNRMHAINGLMFSNLPGLDICKGEKASWHLLGLGTDADVHGVVFQGNTVLMDGMRRDTASLFPHTFATALMQVDNEGSSEVYCQTSNHYQSGMRGHYSVQQCGKKEPFLSRRYERARTVYIMAEEVDWDYAPDRSWELERHNGSGEESYGKVFLSRGNGLLGSMYKKAVYREYTDGTFKTPKNRSSGEEEHLGILGKSIPMPAAFIQTALRLL